MSNIRIIITPDRSVWSWCVETMTEEGDYRRPYWTRGISKYLSISDFDNFQGKARNEVKARKLARRALQRIGGLVALAEFDKKYADRIGETTKVLI